MTIEYVLAIALVCFIVGCLLSAFRDLLGRR